MKQIRLRSILFPLHRYLGLFVGAVLVVTGLTGSILVFSPELENQLISDRIGSIIPAEQPVSIDRIVDIIYAELERNPGLTLGNLLTPQDATSPYQARLFDTNDHLVQLFIDPYTGAVMDLIPEKENWLRFVLDLHYQLVAGDIGRIVVGICALFLVIISITGIMLWPGWKKLITGFKIKWDGHPKRLNFDLHKVIGIITACFLILTAFTGFCWNFYDSSSAIIYKITATPPKVDLVSNPLPGKSFLSVSSLVAIANQALPNSLTTYVLLPTEQDDIISIGKRQPHEGFEYGESQVSLDPYTGEILAIEDSKSLPLGDRILNTFVPLHFGTFGGVFTRILYIFVGLAPLLLLITGGIMWWYSKPDQSSKTA